MPFGDVAGFQQAGIVTAQQMRDKIESKLGPLQPVDGGKLDGEARLYRLGERPGRRGLHQLGHRAVLRIVHPQRA
jgi:cyclic pyranopterin phosphate synthase